jgi:hypothetical protein
LCFLWQIFFELHETRPLTRSPGSGIFPFAASAARYQWSSVRVLCTPDGRACPAVTRGAKGEAG